MNHLQSCFRNLAGAIGHNRDHVSDMTLLLLSQLYDSLKVDIDKNPTKFTAPFDLEDGLEKAGIPSEESAQ